jgi:hypothetical protein
MRQILVALTLAAPLAADQVRPVRIDQPANGTTLIGGSTAVIQWSGSVDRDRDIGEWEAFLSVDGGRYYSVRITPHLDISIHEFRWSVPNVSSRDARILLRFGNEETEQAIELPLTLRIEAVVPQSAAIRSVDAFGESARPGDPGVTQWAEGDRSGQHLSVVRSAIPAITPTARIAVESRPAVESTQLASSGVRSHFAAPFVAQSATRYVARRRASDIVLLGCRFNI